MRKRRKVMKRNLEADAAYRANIPQNPENQHVDADFRGYLLSVGFKTLAA